MTELNPPLHLQNRTDHTAQGDRLLLRSLWRVGGVAQTGDLTVAAQGSPNMSVTVAAGAAIVPGTENAFQGTYHCFNDASKTVTIAASDPTNPRKDIIVAKVQDAFYSGAVNAWSLVAVTGTPAGSPVEPALPANAIKIASINVAANATSITNANITNNTTQARRIDNVWQQVAAGMTYQWYNSAGVLLAELDANGHYKSFGTTGGATKVRKPMCRVEAPSFTIPNAATTKMPYAAANVKYDTDGIFSDANDWLTIQTAGIYRVETGVAYNFINTTGYRAVGITKNNSTELVRTARDAPTTSGVTGDLDVGIVIACNPGDTFHASCFQNSGAGLSQTTAPGYGSSTFLQCEWLAPLT